jgi:hypothetical protein
MPRSRIASLNGPAAALFGEVERVRIRERDGEIQILPTDRDPALPLPPGEAIVALRRAGRGLCFELPIAPPRAGKPQRLEGRKYRWLALVASDSLRRSDPALRVR